MWCVAGVSGRCSENHGLRKQLLQRRVLDSGGGSELEIGMHVVGEHAAAEAAEDARGHLPDPAGADDANRLAVQAEPDQPVEREVPLSNACIGTMDPSVEGEHERHGVLGDGVRRVLRDACDREPEPCRRRQVDVVVAGRAKRDEPSPSFAEDLERPSVDDVVHERAHDVVAVRELRRVRGEPGLEVRGW
jgi:hypothetical protein